MKSQDAVDIERLLADACSPAERSALMQRIDQDPELQAALCDALCEDVVLSQFLAVEHAARRQQRHRVFRWAAISGAAAAVIVASIVWLTVPADPPETGGPSVVEPVTLAAAGRHYGRRALAGEWTYLGQGALDVAEDGNGRAYELSEGLLHWRSSAGPTVPRSFLGRHLRVTPQGTALSLLDRGWGSLVQVHAGAVSVMGRDGVDYGMVEAGAWFRYDNDGATMRGQLLPDPVAPLMVIPFVPIADDTVGDLAHADGRYDLVTHGATVLAHDRHGTLIIGDGALRTRTAVAGIQPIIVYPVDMSCTLEIEVAFPQGIDVDAEVNYLRFLPCRKGRPTNPVNRWVIAGHLLRPALADGRRHVSMCYVQDTRDGKSFSRFYIDGQALSETRGTPIEDLPDDEREARPDAYLIELPAQVAADAPQEERDRAMRYRSLRLYSTAFDEQTVLQRAQQHAWEMPLRTIELAGDAP